MPSGVGVQFRNRLTYLCLFLISLGLAGCPSGAVQQLEPQAAWEQLQTTSEKIYVLDVRTRQEVRAGHLPYLDGHADWYNWQQSWPALTDKPDRDQPVLVYCASGRRSSEAAAALREAGYTQVMNLAGGIRGWQAAGLPIADGGS